MTCLIVDDNKLARTTMRQLASHINDLKVAGECADAIEAYNLLQHTHTDIILLDIEMPGVNGIDFTRSLGTHKPVIIFTTSKKDYAVEAFDLNVADYVVKPVTPARFIQAIDKARQVINSTKVKVTYHADAFVFIKESSVIRRIDLTELLFAEAMGDYVKLHTAQKFYIIHNTLKNVEDKLDKQKFIRVHRSYIIALDKIDSIRDGVVQIGAHTIPVADAYRSLLQKKLSIL
ncbi:MAG TPA: LytTR family DNA-binding domain-containing protein [Ferruginibacter sp.]|nr:LytTR family DNA-binding domain-containing protein [Ferruginibacter sp.]HMP21406.1 LytTR family DNA-binding domain-containing protein [Ferruginibacter sp.]